MMTAERFTVGMAPDPLMCPTQARKAAEAAAAIPKALAELMQTHEGVTIERGLCAYYCGTELPKWREKLCTYRECHECGTQMSDRDVLATIGDSEPQCSMCAMSHNDPRDLEYDLIDGVGFADPGGRSALRAETGGSQGVCPSCACEVDETARWCACCGQKLNPRAFPCPSCGAQNVLTEADVLARYQCNVCASRAEGTYFGGDY